MSQSNADTKISLEFAVHRNRPSVTQGTATVLVNGQELITFADEIEIIHEGEQYYGELIGDWASKKPDVNFILGLLFSPMDEVYHYSDQVKALIRTACNDQYPAKIR